MKKSTQQNELALLHKALRIAAVEAYHSDVIETEMTDLLIGTGKEYPTVDSWIRERVATWIKEAELQLKYRSTYGEQKETT